MKYVHTNLIAKDWRSLSRFYQTVFDCVPVPPERDLSGDWIDGMTGIPGVHITGEHLALPGYGEGGPTLEIFTYEAPSEASALAQETVDPLLPAPGFGHLAFSVEDVQKVAEKVVASGGSYLAEVVRKQYPEDMGLATFVYMRDPEGNILELQSWEK